MVTTVAKQLTINFECEIPVVIGWYAVGRFAIVISWRLACYIFDDQNVVVVVVVVGTLQLFE